MPRIPYIMTLLLLAAPLAARAITFEPPDRDLTTEEKKVGSMYRGCIGFHCLEEEPYLEISIGCEENGEKVCLTEGTNAREGIRVIMAAPSPVGTCLDEASDGMRAMGPLESGCADIADQELVMGTDDQAADASGTLTFDRPEGIRLMSLIAY